MILFCIHFTQNLMLIPNLQQLFPGLLQYFGRYRPWKFGQIPKMSFFGKDSPWLRYFLVLVKATQGRWYYLYIENAFWCLSMPIGAGSDKIYFFNFRSFFFHFYRIISINFLGIFFKFLQDKKRLFFNSGFKYNFRVIIDAGNL